MYIRRLLPALVVVLILSGTILLHAAEIDSTLFTTYTANTKYTGLNWLVCGSTQATSGCYGSGSLGPFGRVGAMIEGNPAQNLLKGTVTRYIYMLDVAYGVNGDGVALYVYKKVDTVTSSDDTVSVTLFKTVSLPLTGGSATVASMAASNKFLFIGTNQNDLAVQVTKSNLAFTQFGAFSGINVSAITADKYGYVTVTWGSSGGPSGFLVLSPTGQSLEDGGGASFMLNTVQAALPSTLP